MKTDEANFTDMNSLFNVFTKGRPIGKQKNRSFMKYKLQLLLNAGMVFVMASCGDSAGPDYDSLVNEGWTLYQAQEYQGALEKFIEANNVDSSSAQAYAGIGWSTMRLNQLEQSDSAFAQGSRKEPGSADIYAGWAFTLNAEKQYEESNDAAEQALAVDLNWSFMYEPALDKNDLHVVKAENYFLLGQYIQSKAEIVILNPAFASIDVTTNTGIVLLAQEIEIRKGLAKNLVFTNLTTALR